MQAGLDILLGLGAGLGDEVEAVVAGGGKGVTVDGADRGHGGDFGGIVYVGNGIVLKVFPDALGAVHRVDKDAGDALLGINLEVGSVYGCPVGADQTVGVDLAHPVKGFLILSGLVYGNQLAVLLDPAVAAAEPCLDNIPRAGVFAHFQTVGVVGTVAVRIVIGELIEHVIDILDRLGGLGDAHGLGPVGAVAQTVAADGAGAGDADDLAVHGQALQNIGADLGQVGVCLAVLQVLGQIPEGAALGSIGCVGVLVQRLGCGQDHRHVVLVHQGQAELLAVGVVGLGAPLDMGAGVGLVLGDDLIGMFIAQHMAGEVGDHKADGGGAGGSAVRRGSSAGSGGAAGGGAAAACEHGGGHRQRHREGKCLFHFRFSPFCIKVVVLLGISP